jgi:hypothetical protein
MPDVDRAASCGNHISASRKAACLKAACFDDRLPLFFPSALRHLSPSIVSVGIHSNWDQQIFGY